MGLTGAVRACRALRGLGDATGTVVVEVGTGKVSEALGGGDGAGLFPSDGVAVARGGLGVGGAVAGLGAFVAVGVGASGLRVQ
jgi:hypothetical protein